MLGACTVSTAINVNQSTVRVEVDESKEVRAAHVILNSSNSRFGRGFVCVSTTNAPLALHLTAALDGSQTTNLSTPHFSAYTNQNSLQVNDE